MISESPLTSIYYAKDIPSLKTRNLLNREEIRELLNAARAFSPGYLYPLIMMFVETAAKTTEVTELVWKDINLEKGEVHFAQTNATQERVLKLSVELVELLNKKKSTKGYVFMTYYGEPFTKNKITRGIMNLGLKAHLKRSGGLRI